MADRYVVEGTQSAVTSSPGDTATAIIASTSTRGRLYEVDFAQGGTPADNAIQWLVRRFTAVGTEGAGVTPVALDSDAPAAQLDGAENHSAEPTFTSVLLNIDVNQRATFRWVAAPDGEFVIPATANNGIGATPISSAYTGAATATCYYVE